MIARRPDKLPDFKRPPLNEIALSLQFGSLPFKNLHSGQLWQHFAKNYPRVEEQPPLAPIFETFGALQASQQQLTLQVVPFSEPSRYWFRSESGNELLQVQRDRLVHNWRQQSRDDMYPRYERVRASFEDEIKVVAEFFEEHSLGKILCNQCEVTYINLIDFGDDTDPFSRFGEIFTIWEEKYSEKFLTKSERAQFNVSYVIAGESGREPLGRLHIVAQPGIFRKENKPAIRLMITARGKPEDETISSALSWLDKGREAAVNAFASITTKKMHRLWQRKGR